MPKKQADDQPEKLDKASFHFGAKAQRNKMLAQGWRPPVTGDPENEAPGFVVGLLMGIFVGVALAVVALLIMGG